MDIEHNRSYRLVFRNTWWQHLLFWAVVLFLLLGIFSSGSSKWFLRINVVYTLAFAFPLVISTYLNLYLLVPLLLSREHYLAYALSLPTLVGASAGCLYLLFDRWIDHILPAYYFISYYSYPELLIFTGSILVLGTLLKLSRSWFKLLRMERAQASQQLHTLQGQINPHFLLNSLQTIYALSLDGHEQTPRVILKLSDILKYTLYETERPRISLEDELALVKDYVDMYRFRIDSEKVEVVLDTDGDPADLRIAPMLLIPFIENCFKHALKGRQEHTRIEIKIRLEGTGLIFQTENTTAGDLPHRKPGAGTGGIGISNTRRRLELLYPEKHRLQIREKDGIFTVKLQLQLDH